MLSHLRDPNLVSTPAFHTPQHGPCHIPDDAYTTQHPIPVLFSIHIEIFWLYKPKLRANPITNLEGNCMPAAHVRQPLCCVQWNFGRGLQNPRYHSMLGAVVCNVCLHEHFANTSMLTGHLTHILCKLGFRVSLTIKSDCTGRPL